MNEMRRIHRSDGAGARGAAAAAGHRVVNTTHSRRESAPPPSSGGGRGAGHAGAPQGCRGPRKEKPEKEKKEKKPFGSGLHEKISQNLIRIKGISQKQVVRVV